MKKIRRITAAFLTVCMIFLLNTTSLTWGAEERKDTCILTLDANGGELEIGQEDIERLKEMGVEIISARNTVLEPNILKDANIASGSDAEQDIEEDDEPDIASDSNAKMRAFGKNENQRTQKPTKIQFSVPDGTELRSILDLVRTDAMGWTTEKNNILTNIYQDSMYGGIGTHYDYTDYADILIEKDMTIYALNMRRILEFNNAEEDIWGRIIRVHATTGISAAVTKPAMSKNDFLLADKSMGLNYTEENTDYQRAFQVNFNGYTGTPTSIFLNIVGLSEIDPNEKIMSCTIFRLSSDGKSLEEIPKCIYSDYGDDEARSGNNLAFMVTGNDKYLVVPTMDANSQMYKVTIDNVKGGLAVASAYVTDSEDNEQWVTFPIGESFSVPYGTELFLEATSFDFLGLQSYMTDEEADKFETEVPETVLQKYIITNANGEQTSHSPNLIPRVHGDLRITPVFAADETDVPEGNASSKPVPALSKHSYSEAVKIDTELAIYKGHRHNPDYKIDVQNLALCDNDKDNEKFYLENGKLKSKDVLPYGSYWITVEFDYEGKHYSGEREEAEERINPLYISVGNAAEFVTPIAYAKFNGIEYPVGCLDLGYDVFYVSSDTKFGEAKALLDEDSLTAPVNYEFSEWVGLDQKSISDTKKVGNSLVAVAKYRNASGKEYHPVIEPLTGGSGNEEENPGENNGNNGNSGGSSGSGSKSSGSSSRTRNYLMSGAWSANSGIWRFKITNGEYAKNQWGLINGSYYYFGDDSNMVTGWCLTGGIWYYLNPAADAAQGAMQTGWILDPTTQSWFYLDASGAMKTGWQLINGQWYYLNPISDGTQGSMAVNRWIDGYYVDATGARAEMQAR